MKALTFILILFVTSSFSQTPDSQIGNDSINIKLLDELITAEINFERINHGLSKLSIKDDLVKKASTHTKWMIKSNTFEHSSNNYEIIEVSWSSDTNTYSNLAKHIVTNWMNSPGHKAIILSKAANSYIGVSSGVFNKHTVTYSSVKKYLYPAKEVSLTINKSTYDIKITANLSF
jgi:uncharacterized protein YkwD